MVNKMMSEMTIGQMVVEVVVGKKKSSDFGEADSRHDMGEGHD